MNCTIPDDQTLQRFINVIEATPPRPHHGVLLAAIRQVLPDCTFSYVLSKGGWHRAGGILDADGNHLTNDLEAWVATELAKCGDNFDQLVQRYSNTGLLATRHMGCSNYFVVAYGPAPEDFLQLEIEEIHEILDRKLFDPERLPLDYQDLVEPIVRAKVEAHAAGSPHYRFVRLVNIREVLAQQNAQCDGIPPLARFMSDWSESRAPDHGHFSEHWLIADLERYTADASMPYTARPMSIQARTLKPFPWDVTQSGAELCNQIRDFDRAAGYPGAWYFHFVGSRLVPDTLVNSLKRDLDSGYHYLADKELVLLNKLVENPYRIYSVPSQLS